MGTSRSWTIVFCLVSSPAFGAEPAGKLVRETWDAAFLNGVQAGYYHVTTHEYVDGKDKLRRVTQELHLELKRGRDTAKVHAETGDVESADGKVVGVFFKEGLAKNLVRDLTGRIQGKAMVVTGKQQGQVFEKKIPWDDNVITLAAEENLLKERNAKPGDRISYRLYSPVVTTVVTTHVTVKEWEKVPLNGVARKLLRVESKPEKIRFVGSNGKEDAIQLPAQTLWFDDKYQLVRSQVEMPGLGEMTLVRTTRLDAIKPVGKLDDIMQTQAIVLNRSIATPHSQKRIVYRITLPKAEDDIEKSFAVGDGRQEMKNLNGKSFELWVTAVRQPPRNGKDTKAGEEYTQSNFFITSADKVVKQHAREAVGDETDPWEKARKIETWVRKNMKVLNFENGILPADHVARHLEGDCTEYAMLAAAMCRAEGVPSRTAIGLVYHVDSSAGKPQLSYHMWTEVFVKGQWLAVDATLGQGSVGPAHLKITDHSWHETRSLTPLLPLMRVMMGKPQVEILKVGE